MADIRLEHLSKNYGKVRAVDDLNLRIDDKEFLTLLGPSGCGKTSTLRLITGLERPDSGTVYIDDKAVNEVSPEDRDVALVFQNYALYPHMTVFDNIAFPLKMRKHKKEEIRQRVKATADLLNIQNLLERKPRQLSGGEAQRVALGRAIVREPRVFLMDEPLSNLDAKLRIHMRAELKLLQRKLQITTIYVTHDQVEAMTMADRIAVMNGGKLIQVSPPEDLYYHPHDIFAAEFVGSVPMNLVEGSVMRDDGHVSLDAGELKYDLTPLAEEVKSKAEGSTIVLGVRPEDVLVEKSAAKGAIQAKVVVVEPLGEEKILTCSVGAALLKARVDSMFTTNVADSVWLKFRDGRIHLFDKGTEQTII
jgi:multiple sugar transport system ATP-binding protein